MECFIKKIKISVHIVTTGYENEKFNRKMDEEEQYQPTELTQIVYGSICERLCEMVEKIQKGEFNQSYMVAFEIGIQMDIEHVLKKEMLKWLNKK